MRAPKVRAPHLGEPRPVRARRAVVGAVRLVFVRDEAEHAAFIAATVTGLIAVAALVVGLVVS